MGPHAHFGASTFTVHGRALTVFDDLCPSHPDVGDQVTGSCPDEVPEKLGIVDRRGETGVVGTQADDVSGPPHLKGAHGEAKCLPSATGGQAEGRG